HGSALAFGFAGHPDASLQKMETALAVEPSSPILNANKGYLLYIARRYEKAQAQLRKALEMDPAFPATHYRLGLVLASQGAHAEATRHLLEAQRLAGDSPYPLGALGHIYARTG